MRAVGTIEEDSKLTSISDNLYTGKENKRKKARSQDPLGDKRKDVVHRKSKVSRGVAWGECARGVTHFSLDSR